LTLVAAPCWLHILFFCPPGGSRWPGLWGLEGRGFRARGPCVSLDWSADAWWGHKDYIAGFPFSLLRTFFFFFFGGRRASTRGESRTDGRKRGGGGGKRTTTRARREESERETAGERGEERERAGRAGRKEQRRRDKAETGAGELETSYASSPKREAERREETRETERQVGAKQNGTPTEEDEQ